MIELISQERLNNSVCIIDNLCVDLIMRNVPNLLDWVQEV